MSFDFSTLKNWLMETETDVLNVIATIKADLAVAESDIDAALHWIASNAPTITSDIQQVVGVAQTIGLTTNPEFAAAVAGANVAVAALNAFANAANSGQSNTQAVLAGYTAVKTAQSSAALAAAALAAPAKTS